jgi:hypothetical protein
MFKYINTMTEDLTQKEILLRLMDTVDSIKDNQSSHISFTTAKLEAIEAQAIRTNGRISKIEDVTIPQMDSKIDGLLIKQENLGVKVAAGVFVVSAVVSSLVSTAI